MRAAGAATLAAALPGLLQAAAPPPPLRNYSRRASKVVERALVIDMLAPLKLEFRPEASAGRLSDEEAALFRASCITGLRRRVRRRCGRR